MNKTKIVFLFVVLLLINNVFSQTINELIQKANSGDASSQYEMGILFYNTNLEINPESDLLKTYYKENHTNNSKQELDSLDLQLYKEWVYYNYVHYTSKSAKQGHVNAQLALGKYYEDLDEYGSKIRAYKWYASSAEQNNEEAVKWINTKTNELYLKQYLKVADYKNINLYADILDLSDKLCHQVNSDSFNKNLDKNIEKEILSFLNITKDDLTYKSKIIDFWNTYNKFFICFDNDTATTEHILKRSLNELFYKHNQILFNWLFQLDKIKSIDFNQVIYYNGYPETILDFLNTILNDNDKYQQFSVIDITTLKKQLIEDFGAKTASKLTNGNAVVD